MGYEHRQQMGVPHPPAASRGREWGPGDGQRIPALHPMYGYAEWAGGATTVGFGIFVVGCTRPRMGRQGYEFWSGRSRAEAAKNQLGWT